MHNGSDAHTVYTHTHTPDAQSQLHLQKTRPHCVFTLFSFCHCRVGTCSIFPVASTVSPSQPDLSLFLFIWLSWFPSTHCSLAVCSPLQARHVSCWWNQCSLESFGYFQPYGWGQLASCLRLLLKLRQLRSEVGLKSMQKHRYTNIE